MVGPNESVNMSIVDWIQFGGTLSSIINDPGIASTIYPIVTLYLEGLADVAAFNWFTSMVENNP